MSPTDRQIESPAARPEPQASQGRIPRLVKAARARYEGSAVEAIVVQLKALDTFNWTTIFGAELLWSALPFLILLGSLANERIDDDVSRHIGLNSKASQIVTRLFRHAPAHAVVPIVTGLLFTLAGVIAVVASLQVLYERVFKLEQRGWRDLPRYLAWIGIVLAVLIGEGSVSGSERSAGAVAQTLVTFVVVTIFFAWTIHFLLDGRVSWRRVMRPALLTALLWVALSLFSSAYFSPTVVDDSKTYGSIGVVFTFLTWFILIGTVIVLGAAFGAVWEQRSAGTTAYDHPRPGDYQSDGDESRRP